MNWLQALLLGLVQGLTEFLPVSSSGHLMIVKELLGVDSEGFLDFTVTVHLATVLSTIVVFWKPICKLLSGFFKFKYNEETDYIFKIVVSMIPVALVGFLLKDKVEALFGDSLTTVAVCLLITAALLLLSDLFGKRSTGKEDGDNGHRNVGRCRTGLCCRPRTFAFRHDHRNGPPLWSKAQRHGPVLFPDGTRTNPWRAIPRHPEGSRR